jgi:hypothetical protein
MAKKLILVLVIGFLSVAPAVAQTPSTDIYVTNCPYTSPPGGSIQKITPAGVATTFATGIGICVGSILFDDFGNMMFVGMENLGASDPNVYSVSNSGGVSVFATGAPLVNPVRLAKDSNGNLIVADEGNPYVGPIPGAIRRISTSGVVSTVISGNPLIQPYGIDVDSSGNYIVADLSASAIFRITPAGIVTTVAIGGAINSPMDVKVDTNGDYIVVNFGDSRILKVTPGGTVSQVTAAPIPGATYLIGLTIDRNGNYIVTDWAGPTIYIVTPAGNVNAFLSGAPLQTPTSTVLAPMQIITSAPTMTKSGIIILVIMIGISAIYYAKKLSIVLH